MYTLNIQYMVGDEAYDLLSKSMVRVLGIIYMNGVLPTDQTKHFHEIHYYVDSEINNGLRNDETLVDLCDFRPDMEDEDDEFTEGIY